MMRTTFLKLLMTCGLGLLAYGGTVAAQVRNFDIPRGDLKNALDAYSRQAGVQVIYRVDDVRGMATAGVRGALDAAEALTALLAKTGLAVSRDRDGAIAIVKMPPPDTKRTGKEANPSADRSGDVGKTLETIEVIAKAEGLAAMRVPTELREIPQSVSVISQDTLQQQNAFGLAGALDWATGITLQQSSTNEMRFWSRGFEISEIHVDGSGPMRVATQSGSGGGGAALDDLSEYDRLEVLRGADGLFGGAGDPGGTVNLVRKQPQATAQASLAATLGSWDFYRLQLDATGPLAFDGALRGRVVTSSTEQHYFYDLANSQKQKLYGVFAYDLGPSTVLSLGGSVEQSNMIPWIGGLPRYANGADPHLPRSVGLVFPENHERRHTTEAFAQLEQRFGEDWKLKIGITRLPQASNSSVANSQNPIDPRTGLIPDKPLPLINSASNNSHTSISVDATLTGGFDWRGRRQDVTAGMDYNWSTSLTLAKPSLLDGPFVNPWRFDPTAYTLPLRLPSPTSPKLLENLGYTSKAIGAYAALRLRPWDGWSIILGGRDNYQRVVSNTDIRVDFGSGNVVSLIDSRRSSVSAGVVTPYAGVVYDLSSHYSLYASYADIYQPSSGSRTFTGEVIPPIQGVNVEAGLKATWFDGLLNGSLAAFRIRRSNQPTFDYGHISQASGECCWFSAVSTSKGVEAELTGRLTPDWQWSAGYTLNVNHLNVNLPADFAAKSGVPAGAPLTTFAPKHLLKLWTQYRLPGEGQRWSVGGGLKAQTANYLIGYICPQVGSIYDCPVSLQRAHVAQGFYAVATLRVAYQIAPHWSAALNIDNLTDRRYYQTIGFVSAGDWYGTPRSLMLTLDGTL